MKEGFRKFSVKISALAGSATVFLAAILVILIWAVLGPASNFSDTWQLIINTGTTIVTFLMVFLIQNTQNRDAKATQLKLDELIRSHKTARDSFIDLEDISDEELLEIADEFSKLHAVSTPTQAIHKLNQKIQAEHARRLGFLGFGRKDKK